MIPEENIYKQRNLELRIIIGVIGLLLLLLGSYTQKTQNENSSLKSTLQQLESANLQQQEKNRQHYDSLEQLLRQQEVLQLQLKDSLTSLQLKRHHLKTRSDENKAVIARLRDADSLRDAVARHYR